MRNQIFKSSHFLQVLFLLFFFNGILFGQRIIKGVVTDASNGETLIGANIVLIGASGIGTVTDFDGNFSLEVPQNATLLRISYTGYTTQEVDIVGLSELKIALAPGEILEDVVVIGYGTVKREDVTGSLLSVKSKDFNKGAIASPQQLLAGKVAGVTITSSGDPGGGAEIRVRGESSLSASNKPLIVVDGVPLDNRDISGERNNLNVINPNDIESMTVLKDASATAIYGNRASAGVILITTKKGSAGKKLSLGYSGSVSVGKITKYVDVLNAQEFSSLVKQRYAADSTRIKLLGNGDTDWQKLIYQNAVGTDHNLNASGSIGALPYRVSVGYTNMNGLLKTDNFERFTGSINLNPKLMDNRLQLNLGLRASHTNNDFADRGSIGNALSFDPTQVPYDPNSKYGGYTTWTKNGNVIVFAPANPLATLNLVQDESKVNRYITNASADYRFKFLPDLRANLNVAYDYSKGDGFKFIDTIASFNLLGTNNTYNQKKENSLLEFYLNYKKDLTADHSLDVMAGYSWQRFGFDNQNISNSIKSPSVKKNFDPKELYLLSLFGRVNYDYKNAIYATFTLRRDGTSRFSPKNRWGLFPAAALSAKILDSENKYLNNVKVRVGWGKTGQQDIDENYYNYLGLYESSIAGAGYNLGDSLYSTLRPNGYDENIKWETTTTYNIGADISFVKDRVNATFDYYIRNTEDLLVNQVPVPAGSNLTNIIATNIGAMKNNGVEISLSFVPVMKKDFNWDLSINMAYNKNEITKLRANPDSTYAGVLTGGISGGVGSNIQIHSVGYQPYSFYVYKQKYDESGKILEKQFEDLNKDGVINIDDLYRYKSKQPNLTFGFASGFTWKNLDFSFAGRSNVGNYIYANVETDMGWLKRIVNSDGALINVHQSAVDNNAELQSSLTLSDHFVRDASFIRIDHITLGYNLSTLLKKDIRIYTTVQNAFVFTKYTGLDPEQFSGIDNQVYPRPRNFVFGLSANF